VYTTLILIWTWVHSQYVTTHFPVVYHEWCFGSHSIVLMFFLLYHHMVLVWYIEIYSSKYNLKFPLIVDNNTPNNCLSIYYCLSILAGSLNRLQSSAKWMLAALPHSSVCTNQWMFLHPPQDLDQNVHRASNLWHMHWDWQIGCWEEEEEVYTHIRVVPSQFCNFQLPHCHHMAQVVVRAQVAVRVQVTFRVQVAFRAEVLCRAQVAFQALVAPVLKRVHLFLYASNLSPDSLPFHCGKQGICPLDFDESLVGFNPSQSSPVYANMSKM